MPTVETETPAAAAMSLRVIFKVTECQVFGRDRDAAPAASHS
jgi:hypothetical protein